MARRYWRELHVRNSCIYGTNLRPFLSEAITTLAGMYPGDGRRVRLLESTLASILGVREVVTFDSARSSLSAILMAMDVGAGDEVIVPGFTCVVVPAAILRCGARPIFVDIQADYRMNVDALHGSLSPRTKVIIAQHTFGFPERASEIVALARARGIRVVEDCAHVLPGVAHEAKALGAWGDAACFSFGRLKTLSGIWGGAAVTRDETLGRRLREIQQGARRLSSADHARISARALISILRHHPDLWPLEAMIKSVPFRRNWIRAAMSTERVQGSRVEESLGRLADVQASLLLCQISELPAITQRRRSCVKALVKRFGGSEIDFPLMWYPFQAAQPEKVVRYFGRYQIQLRTWGAALTPTGCDAVGAGYRWGSCPVAERIGRNCVAIPAMLRGPDLERVLDVGSRWLTTSAFQTAVSAQ